MLFSFGPPQLPIVITLLIVSVVYEIQIWLVLEVYHDLFCPLFHTKLLEDKPD